MRILLDTHIALWAIAETAKLSREVIELLESRDNQVFYSVASVWEIGIKHRLKPEHVFLLKTLERSKDAPRHNDPFDRMLLAQAKYEDLKLITHDSLIPYYMENCIMYV